MKRARVAYAGAIHDATPHALGPGLAGLRLADGRVVTEDAVVWLPPVVPGTIIALGLNYADHAKELAFAAPQEPVAFLKTPGSLVGHRGLTPRPAGVRCMHYECELAVIVGRRARRIDHRRAMEHVAGFSIANDYAIRDYLENWYRPNLRVKNRDACTALGPWYVDASDIEEPEALELRTCVNGVETQRGNTRDLILGIGELLAYLTEFMTLEPGDVILTGTPKGVTNVDIGDEVVCEIEGLGRLQNTIVGDLLPDRGGTETTCASTI